MSVMVCGSGGALAHHHHHPTTPASTGAAKAGTVRELSTSSEESPNPTPLGPTPPVCQVQLLFGVSAIVSNLYGAQTLTQSLPAN